MNTEETLTLQRTLSMGNVKRNSLVYIARRPIVEFLSALLLAVFIITGTNMIQKWTAATAPVTEWFQVISLSVPDFNQGEDPVILYKRQVLQPFSADWHVEIRPVMAGVDYTICANNGHSDYQPGVPYSIGGVTLAQFMGHTCQLQQGQYAIYATWELHRDALPEAAYRYISNVFIVK